MFLRIVFSQFFIAKCFRKSLLFNVTAFNYIKTSTNQKKMKEKKGRQRAKRTQRASLLSQEKLVLNYE